VAVYKALLETYAPENIIVEGTSGGGNLAAALGLRLRDEGAPLPAALLAYHVYLLYVGSTTNETAKWSDWREDVRDGLAYAAPVVAESPMQPETKWPRASQFFLVVTCDGAPPRHLAEDIKAVVGEDAHWKRCRDLKDMDNMYDLGFWGNLMEALLY